MSPKWTYSLFIALFTVQSIDAFRSGLSPEQVSTHYGLTACALMRMTAQYLVSTYNVTRLSRFANSTTFCINHGEILSNLQREIRQLGLVSDLTSVIDAIASANIDVNTEERHSPSSHFSNEQFAEGSTLVGVRLADAVSKLTDETSSIGDVYRVFGQAIHTVQDFYSHSNWIELGGRKPSAKMGTEHVLGLYSPSNFTTCIDCTRRMCAEDNIHSEVRRRRFLISGYARYSFTDPPKPSGKCSHGGSADLSTGTSAVGYGINKDTQGSDHGSYHPIAAEVALAATLQQLQSLRSKVGDRAFRRFLGFQSKNLVITLDTTGSMKDVIGMVKEIIIDILNYTRSGNAVLKPDQYIFSPFNDPGWGPLTITDDAEALIEQIQNLTVYAGGDEPELYYHGPVSYTHLTLPTKRIV